MIAGETEQLMGLPTEDHYDEYDEFNALTQWWGKGKDKQPKREKRVKTKARGSAQSANLQAITTTQEQAVRPTFWKGLGNTIRDGGGIDGVAGSISNLVNLFKKQPAAGPSDYQFGLGYSAPPPEKQPVPSSVYVIGGAVVVGLIVWGVTKSKGARGGRQPGAPGARPGNNIQPPVQR